MPCISPILVLRPVHWPSQLASRLGSKLPVERSGLALALNLIHLRLIEEAIGGPLNRSDEAWKDGAGRDGEQDGDAN